MLSWVFGSYNLTYWYAQWVCSHSDTSELDAPFDHCATREHGATEAVKRMERVAAVRTGHRL